MNWKPGDMAIVDYPAVDAIGDLPNGSVVVVHGVSGSMASCCMRTQYNQEVYSISPVYSYTKYDAIEGILYPIQDPDQHVEPRADELNRPCEA